MSFFAISIFMSCSKNDDTNNETSGTSFVKDGKISGKIVNLPPDVNDFNIICTFHNEGYDYRNNLTFVVPATKDEFSLDLPMFDSEDLYPIESLGGTINNDVAKYIKAHFRIDKGIKTNLELESSSNYNIYVEFYYVDMDVKVSKEGNGEDGIPVKWTLNLKKGWNKVLCKNITHTWTRSTGNIPSDMVWRLQ